MKRYDVETLLSAMEDFEASCDRDEDDIVARQILFVVATAMSQINDLLEFGEIGGQGI